jgi:hypothetical protein
VASAAPLKPYKIKSRFSRQALVIPNWAEGPVRNLLSSRLLQL